MLDDDDAIVREVAQGEPDIGRVQVQAVRGLGIVSDRVTASVFLLAVADQRRSTARVPERGDMPDSLRSEAQEHGIPGIVITDPGDDLDVRSTIDRRRRDRRGKPCGLDLPFLVEPSDEIPDDDDHSHRLARQPGPEPLPEESSLPDPREPLPELSDPLPEFPEPLPDPDPLPPPWSSVPDGSTVSVGSAVSVGEGDGLIDGEGDGLTIDGLGEGVGDGLGTVGGGGP